VPAPIRHLCLALLAFAAGAASADAGRGQATAPLRISLTITPHVAMQVLDAPRSLTLSRADVARGYVDVPDPVRVAVQSNLADGFALSVTHDAEQVQRTEVVAQAEGGRHAWRLRLHLAGGAEAGTVPGPLRLNVAF
jgi:hypothetical protein